VAVPVVFVLSTLGKRNTELTLFWTAKSPARGSIFILMPYPDATTRLGDTGHPDDAGV
jgi:hypothetical protein